MLAPPPFLADFMRVDVADVSALAPALRAAWAELATDAAEPNSFMEDWFAVPSLVHLQDNQQVRVLSVWSDDRLIGVVLFFNAHRYGRIPVRHTINWQSVQSFYGAPLIRKGAEALFWRAIIETLDTVDWAPGFLSFAGLELNGPAHQGLITAAKALNRASPIVHRQSRALLSSTLAPDAYLDEAIRGKKRKELRRLRNRLADLGTVTFRAFGGEDDLAQWAADFLALEAAGWKGSEGAAFANTAASSAFFHEMMQGAHSAGTLEFLRYDLDGRAIAMLINFVRAPGSYSFKIAYDEDLARFSPGVLIELENLKRVLSNPALNWMDSCAVADHPMINSLWMERRHIVQVSVPLSGTRRRVIFALSRCIERTSAALRGRSLR
jgi:CelD/BcsL family acetyltransferase involved in cellulose biosynthesis